MRTMVEYHIRKEKGRLHQRIPSGAFDLEGTPFIRFAGYGCEYPGDGISPLRSGAHLLLCL